MDTGIFQYLFGEDMLVAPVTSKADTISRLATKKIWLPKGQWYELSTGTTLDGDKMVVIPIKTPIIRSPKYPKKRLMMGAPT
jgi:alpha-glucosidase (family GH31 glycosyl hydrolase)